MRGSGGGIRRYYDDVTRWYAHAWNCVNRPAMRITQGQWTAFKNRYSPKKKNIYNNKNKIPDDIPLRELNNMPVFRTIKRIHHVTYIHTHKFACTRTQARVPADTYEQQPLITHGSSDTWSSLSAGPTTRHHRLRPTFIP